MNKQQQVKKQVEVVAEQVVEEEKVVQEPTEIDFVYEPTFSE